MDYNLSLLSPLSLTFPVQEGLLGLQGERSVSQGERLAVASTRDSLV